MVRYARHKKVRAVSSPLVSLPIHLSMLQWNYIVHVSENSDMFTSMVRAIDRLTVAMNTEEPFGSRCWLECKRKR